MVTNSNFVPAMIVNYPNTRGEPGRYSLDDQRDYFNKFEGGSCHIFQLALANALSGDLLKYSSECTVLFDCYYQNYTTACLEIFDNHYDLAWNENTVTPQLYSEDQKEFNRRIFDLYRYAKTSVAAIVPDKDCFTVSKIAGNPQFDSGVFLIR